MTQFESAYNEFNKREAGVVFIAAQKIDGLFRGKKHLQQHSYPFPALFDEKREVTRAYGVHHSLGIDAFNIARRAIFIVDRHGTISWIAVSPHQLEAPPLDDVIAAIEASDKC